MCSIHKHPPHTSYRWRGDRDEDNQCMGMMRRPWWSEASVSGHRGYTSTLYEKCHGVYNDHRESGPRFNVSSEGQCFWQYYPHHYTGALGPTQTTGWAPPAGLTNTSSSRNLVFPGVSVQVLTSSTLLSFSGNRSWAKAWYGILYVIKLLYVINVSCMAAVCKGNSLYI